MDEFLDFEDEPETSILAELFARGDDAPPDLWDLIARLAELNIVIENADHFDDATLLRRLLESLDHPTHVPNDADTVMRLDAPDEAVPEDHTRTMIEAPRQGR